jgi:hypothetical protein
VPLSKGEITQVVAGALAIHVAPPGDAVNVYEVIAGPPVLAGGVSETVAEPFPIVAVTPVGTPGFPAGLIVDEEGEAELLPVALLATVENE